MKQLKMKSDEVRNAKRLLENIYIHVLIGEITGSIKLIDK